MANNLHDFLRVVIKTGTDKCREGADRRAGGRNTMVIQIIVEDSMQEVYQQPGAKQQVEGAVLKTLFQIRDTMQDRISRQSVLSRGFQGTAKT
jgi:hypothetical protein